MADSSDWVLVEGRRIVRRLGARTQTLNVCTPANQVGTYEVTYRLPVTEDLPSGDLEALADLERCVSTWRHGTRPSRSRAASVSTP